ncbi:DUF3907 family protein [Salipaludibacillus agaradhaerens]|uniref:DUF3907 family protein n=1 Tax=Salipaludibacillus agaradhaerens TaxID=76935 RepID=A0A9Q4B1D9_SALAG|nr:YpuI family protein [Salipaludibacillus agaradhaerens]MCR6096578.1 DUF3907 family protein [Salipaludibacillus agaradhaerens]MCR6113863.1 DUF3907 family protein [Salipaludibacillus agaradhaerens]
MGNDLVKQQLELTTAQIEKASKKLREYLNEATLSKLMEDQSTSKEDFQLILDQFRRLLVFFDEGLKSGNVLLRSENFRKGAAEKTLYWIFHQCVEEFFQPHYDVWYEDSRAAYTGRNAIRFRTEVPQEIKDLTCEIEGPLQEVREELEYYETDYRTKIKQREGK